MMMHTSANLIRIQTRLRSKCRECFQERITVLKKPLTRTWSSTTILLKNNSDNYTPLEKQKHNDNHQQQKEHQQHQKQTKQPVIDNAVSSSSSTMMKSLPLSIQPYAELARLDKPIGTMLLLWPCCWSTSIAASATNKSILTSPSIESTVTCADLISSLDNISHIIGDPKLLGLFATGAFLMRGAGCTINDMWDAKYDQKVKRTSTRPLASGVLNYHQATAFLGLQLTGGLAVLTSLPHLQYCFWLGASSLPLVISYPLMKRYTNWPQLVLGMTFNWGAFMGWAATHGSLWNGLSIVGPLYAGGICWTIVYDTLYAHQDKEDDNKLGLKSTALYFGDNTKPILYGFSALATGCWMLAGNNVGFEAPYYYLGCGAAGTHLCWQIISADLQNAKNLAERFKSNNTVGAILLASIVAGNISTLAVI